MKMLRKSGAALLAAVILITAVGAVRNPDIYFLIKKNFTIFSEVYREVSLNYVEEVDPEKLMRRGIRSMLESLDPYTVFVDEASNQEMEMMSRGSYGGVGLEVGFRGDEIVVIAPMDGYSAHRQGIRTGDVIVSVDGVSVEDYSPEQVQNLTAGDPGTTLTITVRRYGLDEPITFELTRERIEISNVAYRARMGPGGNIGYIQLNRFAQNAANEVRGALEELRSEGELEGLVLDLRNNPGGLLGEAVSLVDKFVEPGLTVVETRGRSEEHTETYGTSETPVAGGLPLVVLQNGGSASASEIVSGALQDLDRAVVMGERSFGKGLVQIVKPLSYNTALRITTSRYYIPSGRSIQSVDYSGGGVAAVQKPDSLREAYRTRNGRTVYDGEGIAPDVKAVRPAPTHLQTALMRQNHIFHFANRYASEHDERPPVSALPSVYEEFRSYLREQSFDYRTPAEHYLASADSTIRRPGADSHLTALRDLVEQQKQDNFSEERERLQTLLYRELLLRYGSQKDRIAFSLRRDPVLDRAIGLLGDPEEYNRILTPGN